MTGNVTDRLSTALADRYRLERHVGEGGMATVYLAHDLKHDRKVAVKVLRPELVAILGTERFLNEIKVTAGLQHPHILPLHDSGEADSFLYYVMPFIEGESLRERLRRDKQLSVDEAMEIAKAVGSALEFAHEQGIVHRDIKPENILLQRGQAMVADFGIALAVSAAGGSRLTETGLSLGTPHYMSPEQASGDRELDARSDIYSLGAVVYEMLTGDPPHSGSTMQAIVAKILTSDPEPISRTRSHVPPNVDAAVQRALEKTPADRFANARQFLEALSNPAFAIPTAAAPFVRSRAGFRWDRVGPVVLALAAVFLVVALWSLLRPAPPRPVLRVSVSLPDEQQLTALGQFDVSADGALMVYHGPGDGGVPRLWARRWDALDATPIRDTDGANGPAISPDGLEVAFLFGLSLRVVPVQGGVTRTAVDDSVRCCVRWSPDGEWLYFQHTSSLLARVPSAGGALELLVPVDSAQIDAGFNQFLDVLPGEALVFEGTTPGGGPQIYARRVGSSAVKMLTAGQFPRFGAGHLLFATPDGATLMAAPFDEGKLELSGPATPVAETVMPPAGGWSYFAVSRSGQLVYNAGGRSPPSYEVVWVTREGQATTVDPDWTFDPGTNNRGLALSPDGTRLAVTVLEEANYDIWVKELPRGPASRLTFDDEWDVRPRWTPDGDAVAFLSRRKGQASPFLKRATGTGVAERQFAYDRSFWEVLYSPDSEWLVARSGGTLTVPGGRDVWALRPGTDTVPAPLIVTGFDEKAIGLSPDGRWLSYESDETGRNEVYVRPFPNVEDGKWQVSTGGGVMPVWGRTGRELFYVDADNQMVAARIQPGPDFVVAERTVLFTLGSDLLFRQDEQYPLYDVTPDDRQFVMLRGVNLEVTAPELILVENWAAGLAGPRGR
jgi:serine/threonine-protein kinase